MNGDKFSYYDKKICAVGRWTMIYYLFDLDTFELLFISSNRYMIECIKNDFIFKHHTNIDYVGLYKMSWYEYKENFFKKY